MTDKIIEEKQTQIINLEKELMIKKQKLEDFSRNKKIYYELDEKVEKLKKEIDMINEQLPHVRSKENNSDDQGCINFRLFKCECFRLKF